MALIVAAAATLVAGSGNSTAEPYVPPDDAQVLERLPSPSSQAMRELRSLHAEAAKTPDQLKPAVSLARRYIELGRVHSDPRYNGYAEAALKAWWSLPEPPVEVLVLRATLRQSRHEFDEAMADLTRAIARDPGNAQAWLTRAVIQQVQGDPDGARRSCQSLMRLTTRLVATTCLASADSVSGNAARAIQALRHALDGAPSTESVSVRLWALTVLAETAARVGQADVAQRHYKQALALGVHDTYLLAAYADFLLDQERPREVIALLKDEARIDPLLLRLALAEQRVAPSALTARIKILTQRFDASRLRGDTVHRREEARYILQLMNDPGAALAAAEANWAVQREPADARLLLEAARAANRRQAAKPVLDWLAQTRLEDVHIRRVVDRLAEAPS